MRLPEAEEAALDAQAVVEGRSKSDITRAALRADILRHRRWDAPLLTDEETFDLGNPLEE